MIGRQGMVRLAAAALVLAALAGCDKSDGPGTLPYGSGPDTPTNAAGPPQGPIGGSNGIYRQPGASGD